MIDEKPGHDADPKAPAPHEDTPQVFLVHVTLDEHGQTVTRKLPVSDLQMRRTIGTSPAMWATNPDYDTVSRSIWVMPP